jgi:anti-sigma regulatory factor (Ser/Thr protein kinase)
MTADEAALLTLEPPPRPEAAGAARTALASLNGSLHLISDAHRRDAQTAITEVVTNAIVHGGDGERPVRVEVRADVEALRVIVIDAGPGFDPARVREPSTVHGGGWGLRVVDSLVSRWGVETGALTSVWFEIDRPQAA